MRKNFTKFALSLMLALSLSPTLAYADDGGDDDGGGIALLLAAGPIYYAIMSAKYSGSNKRHLHERETESQIENLECTDEFVRLVRGTREPTVGEVTYSNEHGTKELLDSVTKIYKRT